MSELKDKIAEGVIGVFSNLAKDISKQYDQPVKLEMVVLKGAAEGGGDLEVSKATYEAMKKNLDPDNTLTTKPPESKETKDGDITKSFETLTNTLATSLKDLTTSLVTHIDEKLQTPEQKLAKVNAVAAESIASVLKAQGLDPASFQINLTSKDTTQPAEQPRGIVKAEPTADGLEIKMKGFGAKDNENVEWPDEGVAQATLNALDDDVRKAATKHVHDDMWKQILKVGEYQHGAPAQA